MQLAIAAIIFGIIILLEAGLRWQFGFGNPLIYTADEQIGYLLAPNQQTRRYGNLIIINQYSMRSSPINPTRSSDTLRLLLLGDSIANGGWWTDQNQTIAAQISRQLESIIPKTAFAAVEVLNASANSWGPRNELAYMQKFGIFDAQAVILLLNTDDLFAPAPSALAVGRDRNYPNRKPPLAIVEAFWRILPYQYPAELAAIPAETGDRVGRNLGAIAQIQQIAANAGSQFLLAMTPLLREVTPSGSRDYELAARKRLAEFVSINQIVFIDFLPIFQAAPVPANLYRDTIHLSTTGDRLVSETLGRSLLNLLKAQM